MTFDFLLILSCYNLIYSFILSMHTNDLMINITPTICGMVSYSCFCAEMYIDKINWKTNYIEHMELDKPNAACI